MKDGLYHREVFWHGKFDLFFQNNDFDKIDFTNHVYNNNRKAENRVYDIKDITIDFIKDGTIFEVLVKKDRIKKVVIRKKYTGKDDICMVFVIDKNILRCKTCWLNNCDDKHYTLNVDRYVKDDSYQQQNAKMTVSIFDLVNSKKKK